VGVPSLARKPLITTSAPMKSQLTRASACATERQIRTPYKCRLRVERVP
jgi:hypothetical protein